MAVKLSISIGQYSQQGIKEENQDCCGVVNPNEPQLTNKGITAAVADGVSSCINGREAAESCINSFLSDYYSTPDSWTTKTSAHKILTATNSWLYHRGQQSDESGRGLITTFSALILKSTTAHIFHVGDSRVYRLQGKTLEQLTNDHRRSIASNHYLSRAVGIDIHLDIDYTSTRVEAGDIFILTTDGVHDFVDDNDIARLVSAAQDLDSAAKAVGQFALANDSNDNITCQVLRVESLPLQSANEAVDALTKLPFPPDLKPGMILDGYRIEREIHASKRTQVYKATDTTNEQIVVIKTPSVNFEDDPGYIESFVREEWIGQRIHNSRVLKIVKQTRPRQFLYYVTEYIDGQTLREWMNQHSQPDIKEVRLIVEQIATGLRAFHRLQMLHQDLKPENIMIDAHGKVSIIDFGSTKIAGIAEIFSPIEQLNLLGTKNYTAPEYLLGQPGSNRSDIFSLATITYELLTGKLPYGTMLDKMTSLKSTSSLKYHPSNQYNPMIPLWMDRCLQKAISPDPESRYGILSEFIYDLSHPNHALTQGIKPPILEQNPLAFWRSLAIIMMLFSGLLLYLLLTSMGINN
ncbi:MAG: bifunctional protein-serine/threonine kinase/phosphatase [Gammaproteobacteria bacterium]|nr:bifunctional protein-serine/threonine kinase/phosphatase [Gammaproteobacteria bacterium]